MPDNEKILEAGRYILKKILNLAGPSIEHPLIDQGTEGEYVLGAGKICLRLYNLANQEAQKKFNLNSSRVRQVGIGNAHFVDSGIFGLEDKTFGWYSTALH
jgi:hypothetical protein